MYIAHKCTNCHNHDVTYNNVGQTHFYCRGCGFAEDENSFWQAMRSEAYLRELEHEIESRYPFKDIDVLGNTIDLAIGWHVLGKYDSRDKCIETILKEIKEIHDKWQICYCNFGKVERRMNKYEQLGDEDERKKYQVHLDSMREFFKDFPEKMKSACK